MPFSDVELAECDRLLDWGLAEDLGSAGDVTSLAVVDDGLAGSALIVVRAPGVVAGLPMLEQLVAKADGAVQVELLRADGAVEAGTPVARFNGQFRAILGIERLALNILGRLSGVASLTAVYVNKVRGTKAQIADTRKTTPGWRYLEKYAVRVGGGANHRIGLFDAVLIKDNHLAAISAVHEKPIVVAVERARTRFPELLVEVEVDTLEQLDEALSCRPDFVLLDNMKPPMLEEAVRRRDRTSPTTWLEASGGVNLDTVAAIAKTGVDRISVGALTHSAPGLDIALDYELSQAG